MKQIVSPKGSEITGILERLTATVVISPESIVAEDGRIDFEYEGSSEMHFNAQVPVIKSGKRIFMDDMDNEVPEQFLCFIDPENGVTKPTPLDETKQYVLVQVDEIEWDLSGEADPELVDAPPTSLEIEFLLDAEATEEDLDEAVSDKITEQTSFCHTGFTFNRLL